MTPKELAPVLPQYSAAREALMGNETVQKALAAIKRDEQLTIADQIAITEIEAPPFHEENRGTDLIRRFKELGLTDVTRDSEGNVIAIRKGTGNWSRRSRRTGTRGASSG